VTMTDTDIVRNRQYSIPFPPPQVFFFFYVAFCFLFSSFLVINSSPFRRVVRGQVPPTSRDRRPLCLTPRHSRPSPIPRAFFPSPVKIPPASARRTPPNLANFIFFFHSSLSRTLVFLSLPMNCADKVPAVLSSLLLFSSFDSRSSDLNLVLRATALSGFSPRGVISFCSLFRPRLLAAPYHFFPWLLLPPRLLQSGVILSRCYVQFKMSSLPPEKNTPPRSPYGAALVGNGEPRTLPLYRLFFRDFL